MDKLFKRIPELTEEQFREINSYFTAYIFYKRNKVRRPIFDGTFETETIYECTCTACNSSFAHNFENEPKHNDAVTCPRCGTKATLKHINRGKKNLREVQRVILFCPENENAVWMRAFYASKNYNGDPEGNKMLNSLYTKADEALTPEVELSETARYFLTPGEARCFKFDYSYYGTHRWYEVNPREPFNSYMNNGADYYILGKELLTGTFMKYLDINTYHKAAQGHLGRYSLYYYRNNLYTTRFICDFAKYPIIESLLKAGFGELVAEKIMGRAPHKRTLDWNATKLTDFFKTFNKSEIKVLKNEDYQVRFLKTYAVYKTVVSTINLDVFHSDVKLFGYDELIELCRLVKKYSLNFTKAKNYLKRQNPKKPQLKIGIYKDYLDFAKRLEYDLTNDVVLYPKKLGDAHNTAAATVSALVREEQAQKMRDLTNRLTEKYSFEYGGLQIVVPQSMQEIIDEGKALSHCVGGYAERHANGTLAILFIRKKSALSTPYVTMEVQGKRIMQYHGYQNDRGKPLSQQVKSFVKEFEMYIQNPSAYMKMKNKEEKSA